MTEKKNKKILNKMVCIAGLSVLGLAGITFFPIKYYTVSSILLFLIFAVNMFIAFSVGDLVVKKKYTMLVSISKKEYEQFKKGKKK